VRNSEWFITDPLGGLADADWDEMAGGRFYSSAFWLRLVALEPGPPPGGLHVAVPGGGRAAVPVAAVEDACALDNPHLRWTSLLAERGLPSPPARGLLVGQRRGYLAHLLHTPGTDPVAAASAVVEAVRSAAQTAVALYLTTEDALTLRAAGLDTVPVALAADAWTEIPPGGWDEWLERASRRSRYRRRREVKLFEDAGYRVEHHPLPEVYEHVGRLTARTQARYGIDADPEQYVEAFRKHAELAGDRAEVLLAAVGDEEPVGCCLYMRDGDTVYVRAVGFDYDRLRDAAEYANLDVYQLARLPGVRWLHAGIGSTEGKAVHGAELRPLWLVDLSADSPLLGRDDEVRAHNSAFHAELTGNEATAKALSPDWDTFS
jgi:hypothetical protein